MYLETIFNNEKENVQLARDLTRAFLKKHNFDMKKISEIKSVVTELVQNAIDHAYEKEGEIIKLSFTIHEGVLKICVCDFGKGIDDIEKAKEPLYSTKEGHSGLGFVIVEVFSDSFTIESEKGYTRVKAIWKNINI